MFPSTDIHLIYLQTTSTTLLLNSTFFRFQSSSIIVPVFFFIPLPRSTCDISCSVIYLKSLIPFVLILKVPILSFVEFRISKSVITCEIPTTLAITNSTSAFLTQSFYHHVQPILLHFVLPLPHLPIFHFSSYIKHFSLPFLSCGIPLGHDPR